MPNTRERFLTEGTTFTNAFATTPTCCPSRATIFTGRYAHNHGVRMNMLVGALDHRTTLQRYLQEEGYRTALVGKFLNLWNVAEPPPFFDRFALLNDRSRTPIYTDPEFNVDGRSERPGMYSTDAVATYSKDVVEGFEREDDRPWLLYVTPNAPHAPFTPEPEYARSPVTPWSGNPAVIERDLSDKLGSVVSPRAGAREALPVRRQQLQTLRSVDDLVGQLFAQLDELDETRDTIAFFTSDNGFLWGEHGIANTKLVPYTTSVRVPLMLRWPGRVPPGSTDRRLVANVDLAPTILEATGAAPALAAPLDGRSMLSAPPRTELLLEFTKDIIPRFPDWASIRTDRSQYVEYYTDGGNQPVFREYYDLVKDPWQLENVLRDPRQSGGPEATELEQRLRRLRRCSGTSGPSACP